jgi:hypothetical protein
MVLGAYVALLFVLAAWGDARAARFDRSPSAGPWLYTLALAVYCTSWTFYGAVGEAARATAGTICRSIWGRPWSFCWAFPSCAAWWRLGREHNTSSIADFLSLRYGKSAAVGALATLAGCCLALIPYIALQLKSAAASLDLMTGDPLRARLGLARGDRLAPPSPSCSVSAIPTRRPVIAAWCWRWRRKALSSCSPWLAVGWLAVRSGVNARRDARRSVLAPRP